VTLPSAVDIADEVVSRASSYRRFGVEYKRRIISEYDLLPSGDGSRGSLLRREGLRRNQISEWRKTREMLEQDGQVIKVLKKQMKRTPERIENDRLMERNAKLEAELARTKLALEITGKAHALLEMLAESADTEVLQRRSSWSR
jgi:transposase